MFDTITAHIKLIQGNNIFGEVATDMISSIPEWISFVNPAGCLYRDPPEGLHTRFQPLCRLSYECAALPFFLFKICEYLFCSLLYWRKNRYTSINCRNNDSGKQIPRIQRVGVMGCHCCINIYVKIRILTSLFYPYKNINSNISIWTHVHNFQNWKKRQYYVLLIYWLNMVDK